MSFSRLGASDGAKAQTSFAEGAEKGKEPLPQKMRSSSPYGVYDYTLYLPKSVLGDFSIRKK